MNESLLIRGSAWSYSLLFIRVSMRNENSLIGAHHSLSFRLKLKINE